MTWFWLPKRSCAIRSSERPRSCFSLSSGKYNEPRNTRKAQKKLPDYNGIRGGHIYCPFRVSDICKSCQKKKCQPGKLREYSQKASNIIGRLMDYKTRSFSQINRLGLKANRFPLLWNMLLMVY